MSDLIQLLLQPFSFGFMQQAFVITLLVAIPMGLLSPFLVLKGWSLMGDAISHAVLPGVVLAYIAGIPLAIGAFAAGMICALATGFLKQNSRVKEEGSRSSCIMIAAYLSPWVRRRSRRGVHRR